MMFYALTATVLAASTLLALWTAMAWPHPRADVTAGVLGASSVAIWSAFNNTYAGPHIGSLPFTLADLASLPALLVSSLLVGRTMLLRNHPFPHTAPATETGTHDTGAREPGAPEDDMRQAAPSKDGAPEREPAPRAHAADEGSN